MILASSSRPVAVCLMGPTATGKSELALELASRYPFEIVSVDSAQVYRGMDIGTAKPDEQTRRAYPHHLVDIRDPSESYSAAEFRRDAIEVMVNITERGRIPLLTGGTMLYFKALRDGIARMPAANPGIRDEINDIAAKEGWAGVHERLAEVDPVAASRIHPNDPQRLQRALEVFRITGTPLTAMHGLSERKCPFRLCEIGIVPDDRQALHGRIARRLRRMLAHGFVEEVSRLREREDLNEELPSIKAVGYRQIWAFLEGRLDREAMEEKAIVATRQLAKRQYTWLRGWTSSLQKIDRPHLGEVLKVLQSNLILDEL